MADRPLLRWMLLFVLIPLGFIVRTWSISDGIPYFTDSNETYSAFVHASNMYVFDPAANAFLTDESNSPTPGAHPFTYTHQANLPRYLSYILMVTGVRKLEQQVLIAAVFSTGLALWFVQDVFRGRELVLIGTAVLAFFTTDFMGVLQWTVNLFRMWHLPLFWGCLACTRRPFKPWFTFVLFFLLLQMEFVFAVFTTVTCLVAVWAAPKEERALRTAAAMVTGAAASVGLFVTQLVLFYGWDGFLYDMSATYLARNSTTVSWDSIRAFYERLNIEMWPSFPSTSHGFLEFLRVTHEYLGLMYSPLVRDLAYLGAAISISHNLLRLGLAKRGISTPFRIDASLSKYLHATIAGYVFLGLTISGYTLTAYTQRWGPILAFPMIFALGLLATCLGSILSGVFAAGRLGHIHPRPREAFVALAVLALLVPWVRTSIAQYRTYPPLIADTGQLLRTAYRGHTFVSHTTYPHMIAHYTGNWAYYSPLFFTSSTRLDQTYNWNADRFTNTAYLSPEYYLCQQVPYMRHINCDDVGRQMERHGHQVVAHGAGFAIIKLNWFRPASTGDPAK